MYYFFYLTRMLHYLDRFHMNNKKTSLCIEGCKMYREMYFDKIKNKIISIITD